MKMCTTGGCNGTHHKALFLLQGGHLHRTQPGATEESSVASETEHVRTHRCHYKYSHELFLVVNVDFSAVSYPSVHRSLIEQLKKLQSMVKMSTLKASTTSTCVMVRAAAEHKLTCIVALV